MRRMPLLALLAFLLPLPAGAGLQEGWSAYYRGDYETAFKELKPVAERGHPAAQVNLGLLYEEGKGVEQDYAKALTWYRRAAAQDYAEAQYRLGLLHETGRGVGEDPAEAVAWYRRAALGRDTEAMESLGRLYADGVDGIAAEPLQAFMWTQIAVDYLPKGTYRDGVLVKRDRRAAALDPAAVETAKRLVRHWRRHQQGAARSRAMVRDLQASLAALGYNPGPADGLMGKRTAAAIRDFEGDHGMAQSGEISPALEARVWQASVERLKGE